MHAPALAPILAVALSVTTPSLACMGHVRPRILPPGPSVELSARHIP